MCLLCSGCVAKRGTTASSDGLGTAHAADAHALAAYSAQEMSARHAPAHTPLSIDKAPGLFGEALEAELRARGFAVASGNASSLRLSYTVGISDEATLPFAYARLCYGDGENFSFSRRLGAITEPPHSRPIPAQYQVETRNLPPGPQAVSSAAYSPSNPVKLYKVRETATAAAVARRNGVPVRDFCAWNQVGTLAVLEKGYEVYLSEPPEGLIPVAATVHVPDGVESRPMMPSSASIPTTTPTARQISPALTLEKPQPPAPASAPLQSAPAMMAQGKPVAAQTEVQPAAAVIEEQDSPAPVTASPLWEIHKGEMLHSQMEAWAAVGGYSLIWNAQHDYEMRSNAAFSGSFIEAVKDFFAALQANGLALRVTIYQGNKVMEVSEH